VLRLTRPIFTGLPWVAKQVLDRLGAILLLLLVAPLLLVLAVGVKLDGGPVFVRQTRLGRHGHEFNVLKFRSTVIDAEARQPEQDTINDAGDPLFKGKTDQRLTPFGAVLRRYSLDELPQLFNVLGGTMSLVGPRPPLPNEVITSEPDDQRRLLTRPGLTGLWQISGRRDLCWEQSVRLNLRYVENWNLALDALILWKTIRAVLNNRGT
jgi:lipopolysaccharide/colanic/teichoic acid biosynthesis glycosyltransferase